MNARVTIVPIGRGMELHARVFVCNDAKSRWRGMRGKDKWGYDGMLFAMPNTGMHSFTMDDTYLPLDIVFIAPVMYDVGRISTIHTGRALSHGPYEGYGKWILELPAGTCMWRSIRPGSMVLLASVPEAVG